MNGVLIPMAVTNTTQILHLDPATPRPTFPSSFTCAPPTLRAANKLSSGAWNEKQASMNFGKAARNSHSLQCPDMPVPSLREKRSVRVFPVAAANSKVPSICVQQAQTKPPLSPLLTLSIVQQPSPHCYSHQAPKPHGQESRKNQM